MPQSTRVNLELNHMVYDFEFNYSWYINKGGRYKNM